MNIHSLHHFLENAACKFPDRPAVVEPGEYTVSYSDLAQLSDKLRDRLVHIGVQRADRVGICLHKSIDSVAAIFGILKSGAAYVPVDPGAPASRSAYVFGDCSIKALVAEQSLVEKLQKTALLPAGLHIIGLEGTAGGRCLAQALAREQELDPAPLAETVASCDDDLAYILYTSGSTGKPKGVMLSHLNGVSYVNWCSQTFQPTCDDCFSSHAPFHFDLSILDIYVPLKHGAALVLISEELGKEPVRLAQVIAQERISVWYSTPSILSLLAQYGRLQEHSLNALRLVLFAGEVFPVKHLRAIKTLLPLPRYFNLYGPTETNVCTYYEIPADIAPDRVQPYPIGKTCSHVRTKVVDETGREVPIGQEGELCVTGEGVMCGYWNLPEQTERAFLKDQAGCRWYKTGDIVTAEADGTYVILGRRDRMVKRRGYRIELDEIEMALYRHPSVKEAAAVALPAEDASVCIKAILSCREGSRPSLIELKRFCIENLPTYMVPDTFSFRDVLPKTSTDKMDYQRLKEMG
jgi:amino acid adenylation domain-containing protein